MGVLRIVIGRATKPEFDLGDSVTIGRGEENGIRLYDETSSRKHAEVVREGEGFRVRDLGSSNGTFLNGLKVDSAVLADGDEIVVGATRLRFETNSAGARDTVVIAETGAGRVESTLHESELKLGPGAKGIETVYAAGRQFAGELQLGALLDKVCEAVFAAIAPDRATVVLLHGEEVVDRARRGTGDLVLSRGVVRQVLDKHAAVLVADVPRDPQLGSRDSLVTADVRSVLCAPLEQDGRVLGLLYLDRSSGSFTTEELQIAVAIARDAAPAVQAARAFSAERQRVQQLQGEVRAGEEIVGGSASLAKVLDIIRRAAPTDTTVLIRGETGTGKELIARAIHRQSPRHNKPFIAVNCAALVGSLLESELFGYEKGAFTGAAKQTAGKFEQADGGTIFLDEIGEMAAETQATLLRALQEREFYRVGGTKPVKVDIRVVAATNKDLEAEIRDGGFREDLYYRLSVVAVDMPPLRDRLEDLPELIDHFLRVIANRSGRRVPALGPKVLDNLRRYHWPGNIRELANLLERAIVLSASDTLELGLFPPEVRGESKADLDPTKLDVITLKEAERRAIIAALRHTGWKKGETAKLLGCSWPTLNKKIEDYDISKADTGE
ncbi:MAG: sigma 54-interacting transcriptional regulator [Planctomycetota bacterium]